MYNDSKVKDALNRLLEMFESGDMPEAVAKAVIKRKAGFSPSDKWSLGNLLLRSLAGTDDARGFRQWEAVGRKVKKGAKAFYILAPMTKRIEKEVEAEDEKGNKEVKKQQQTVITGFKAVPVFRYEDTEGKPIPKADYRPAALPPLAEVAEEWGIKIKYGPFVGRFYGYYDFSQEEIFLATHDVSTFFHELGHAAHKRIKGSMKGGQDADQEIIAEMTAAVLCRLYGFKNHERYTFDYVSRYSGKDVLKAVMKLLSEIEQCVNLILETASKERREIA